jgi:hypothetical protein
MGAIHGSPRFQGRLTTSRQELRPRNWLKVAQKLTRARRPTLSCPTLLGLFVRLGARRIRGANRAGKTLKLSHGLDLIYATRR